VETYMESRSSIGMISQGYSEVDKASLHATFPDLSPIRISTPAKRSPGLSPIMSCGQQNKSFGTGFSSPKQGVASGKRVGFRFLRNFLQTFSLESSRLACLSR